MVLCLEAHPIQPSSSLEGLREGEEGGDLLVVEAHSMLEVEEEHLEVVVAGVSYSFHYYSLPLFPRREVSEHNFSFNVLACVSDCEIVVVSFVVVDKAEFPKPRKLRRLGRTFWLLKSGRRA